MSDFPTLARLSFNFSGNSPCSAVRVFRLLLLSAFVLVIFISCHEQTKTEAGLPRDSAEQMKSLKTIGNLPDADDPIPHYSGTKESNRYMFNTPKGFEYSKVNVYIRGQKINLLESGYADIVKILGERTKQNSGRFFYSSFDGLKLRVSSDPSVTNRYFNSQEKTAWLGDIYLLSITTPDYFIEGGGKVGDTFESILRRYPQGIYNDVLARQSASGNLHYDYLVMGKDNQWGTGFDFEIDSENHVVSIDLREVLFTP